MKENKAQIKQNEKLYKPSDMYSKILCRAQAGKSFNETDNSIKLS